MTGQLDACEAPPLETGDVHVWQVDLDSERGDRAYVRRLLAAYVGVESSSLSFVAGTHGKPALASGAMCFNVSHSGNVALVAVARKEVGVDVERVEPERAFGPIADQLFARTEAALLRGLPATERIRVFYSLWTRKEAYVKATGHGLSHPLRSLPVRPKLATPDAELWHLCDLDIDLDLAAALCVEKPVARIKRFRLGPTAIR
jgi:4'-phosphopantetheinyl transferase